MKFAYYPGCSLESTAKEYDSSTRDVFKALGIELSEVDDWNCCGSSMASSTDYLISLALPARNLAIAEKDGVDMIVPCPECYLKQWKVSEMIKEDPEVLKKINKTLEGTGLELSGSIDVKHPVYVIVNEYGLENLKEKVTRPLKGIRGVPYYGCVLLRPPRSEKLDSTENPMALDRILTTVGAEVLPYDSKMKCCGGALMFTNRDVMLKLTYELLKKAKEAGANCIITACPLCHLALDGRQRDVEKAFNEKIDIPIIYFTQLIGLALGMTPKKLGLDKNFVSANNLLKSLGI